MKRILILLSLVLCTKIFACSIFLYFQNGKGYFCANEDWLNGEPATYSIPKDANNYGLVLLGWKSYLPSYPQTGINSEGLCFDWAAVPTQKYYYTKGKEDLTINSTIDILKKCRDVEEAIKYTDKYDYSHLAEEHLFLVDKKGNSCVIEYTKGLKRIIKKTKDNQYITNFNLTDKENGWYPCARYNYIDEHLRSTTLDVSDLVLVLKYVHQENEYKTLYSYIYSIDDQTLMMFCNSDFNKAYNFYLPDLLNKSGIQTVKK
jgi:predicted choloylglycine hydrolase